MSKKEKTGIVVLIVALIFVVLSLAHLLGKATEEVSKRGLKSIVNEVWEGKEGKNGTSKE